MGRLGLLCMVVLVVASCDEPVGPQPDKPILPPEGYTGAPPVDPAAPPSPAPKPKEAEAAAPVAPAAPPEPEKPKCPADVATVLTAKAKAAKQKKRIELKLGAKAGGPAIEYRKVRAVDEGSTEDVKTDGAELTALLSPATPKSKLKLTVTLLCGWEDRTVTVVVDAKSLQVTLKELPPPPEPGYLNVAAEPGTKVSASGKELGVTPLRNVPLAPGKYQLKLEPKKGKPKTVALEIKSGQTANVPMADEKKKR